MAVVYISSTQEDLKAHRAQVKDLFQHAGNIVRMMEYYGPDGGYPIERCVDDVAGSDLYVGLIGWCYGSVPAENNPQRESFTVLEYREAMRRRRPCLIAMHDEKALWPVRFVDKNREGIERFRAELRDRHLVVFFDSLDDLRAKMTQAILDEAWQRPLDRLARKAVRCILETGLSSPAAIRDALAISDEELRCLEDHLFQLDLVRGLKNVVWLVTQSGRSIVAQPDDRG